MRREVKDGVEGRVAATWRALAPNVAGHGAFAPSPSPADAVNRALMVPAVLCLVVGAVLGVWGWGERDAARARIIERVDRHDGPEGGPFFDFSPEEEACLALYSAASLQVPAGGPVPPFPGGPGDPGPGDPVGESERSLVAVLDPATVAGVPGLDGDPDLAQAMAVLQDALVRALDEGREPRSDAEVRFAAQELGRVLNDVC